MEKQIWTSDDTDAEKEYHVSGLDEVSVEKLQMLPAHEAVVLTVKRIYLFRGI